MKKTLLLALLATGAAFAQPHVTANGREVAVEQLARFDVPVRYARCTAGDGRGLRVELALGAPVPGFRISSLRHDVSARVAGNRLVLDVPEPQDLVLHLDGQEDFFLFVDGPARWDLGQRPRLEIASFGVDPTGARVDTALIQRAIDETARVGGVLHVPTGVYRSGQLNLRSHLTLLLDEGALLCGSLNPADYPGKALLRGQGVEDVRLLGRGTVDGSGWAGLRKAGATDVHLVFLSDCRNIEVDGLVLRDPTFWNTRVFRSENVHLRHVKVVNNRPRENWTNTDGVDFDSSSDCSLEDAFVHAGDDNLVVKGLDDSGRHSTRHIRFERVLTVSNSAVAKIGTETCVPEFRDVVFRDVDAVRCKRAMVIDALDHTAVHGVRFENFHIESFALEGSESPRLIDFEITNKTWRPCDGNCTIEDVSLRNVQIDVDPAVAPSRILGRNQQFGIRGVTVTGLTALGRAVATPAALHLQLNDFVSGLELR